MLAAVIGGWMRGWTPTSRARSICGARRSPLSWWRRTPTLTRHRGTVFVGFGFTRTHWWCQDGAVIVDPTVRQFDQWAGVLSYEEFIPDARGEPTGKCPDCGELVYGDTFCDATCAARTLAYLNARSPVL